MSQIECSFRLHTVIDPMCGSLRSRDHFVVEWHWFEWYFLDVINANSRLQYQQELSTTSTKSRDLFSTNTLVHM